MYKQISICFLYIANCIPQEILSNGKVLSGNIATTDGWCKNISLYIKVKAMALKMALKEM